MVRRLVAILFLCVIHITVMGQSLNSDCHFPFVCNYTPGDYNSSNTNWSIAQSADGRIYAANDHGLMVFNGEKWEKLFPFGDDRTVRIRSLCPDGDIIFIGAYREFGYFGYNDFGEVYYHSLSSEISDRIGNEDEIWHIRKHKENVFFLYFNCCYVYNTHTQKTLRINISSSVCFDFRGDFYLSSQTGHLYKWDEIKTSFETCPSSFPGSFILNMFDLDGQTYAVTSQSGILKKNEKSSWQRIDSLGDDYPIVNRSILCKDQSIILGTIGDGVMSVHKDGHLNWKLDKASGLQNNDVMSLAEDCNGNLWVALDKGISTIYKDGPSFIPAPESIVGKVTALFKTTDGRILIGSNNGLYIANILEGNPEYIPIGGLKNQIWSISEIENNVFVGGNTGTYLISADNRLTLVSDVGGGTKVLKRRNGDIVQASFAPIKALEKHNGEWVSRNYIKDFYVPAYEMQEDHLGNLWVEHMYQGLYRISQHDGKDTITCYRSLEQDSRPEKIQINRLGGRLVFSNSKRFYVYDDLSDQIIPYNALNERLNGYPNIKMVSNSTDGTLWVIFEDCRISLIENDGGSITLTDIVDGAGLGIRMPDGNADIVNLNDNTYAVPIEGGFLSFEKDNERLKNGVGHLGISSIHITDGHGKDINKKSQNLRLNASSITLKNGSSLDINLFHSSCKYNNSVKVTYSLKGYDETEHLCDGTMRVNYVHLPRGNYEFNATLSDSLGEALDAVSLNVLVLPSFWGSWAGILLYLALAASLAYGIYLFVRHLLKRQKDRMQEIMDKEMIALRNKQLEESLLLKSDDLVKYSLIEAQRNNVLDQLREKINSMRMKESSEMKKSDFRELMRIIENGGMSSDAWGTFYNNFDLVHDSFFTNLSNRYPSLTQSDLRYCAYLRLNMTTKEIAKATGVTIKGVEAAKGRLRKKMEIPQDISICTFLLNQTLPYNKDGKPLDTP